MGNRRKRVVIKIGTSTLIDDTGRINTSVIQNIANQVYSLKQQNIDVVIVSSGAIACGLESLNILARPSDLQSLQAAASVGQSALVASYSYAFKKFDITTSLVLLTRHDISDRSAYVNARRTFDRLLDFGVVPIVNENDTVSVEQINFGDNDTLAALVACLIGANNVLILSDVDGLYNANPGGNSRAVFIPVVEKITPEIQSLAKGPGTKNGSGGMITKIEAARVLSSVGITTTICNGRQNGVIVDAINNKQVGTCFVAAPKKHEITSRKLWIALSFKVNGFVVVDKGARDALICGGASLLCVGIKSCTGTFEANQIIDVKDEDKTIIARGIAKASSGEIKQICAMDNNDDPSTSKLRNLFDNPFIHRDDMILFE